MKNLKHILGILFTALLVASCGGNNVSDNAESFQEIENEIKSEFGKNAYFTEVSITHNESVGNIVGVTVTKEPESMKMGQWNFTSGNWQQNSEISIETPAGSKAADFMFQLGNEVSLSKLGDLVEKSKEALSKEKDLKNPRLHLAFVKYPDTGDASKVEYIVMLQPETGGTTFTYSYKLDGTFIEMDY